MEPRGKKIVIVGAGQVGATTAYALLLSGLASELVLIDLNKTRTEGEVLDLSHGIPLCPAAVITSGDYPDCAGADIVILTAGVAQKPGETRIDLLKRNIAVFEAIVPRVVKYAPEALLLVVTNPVDVLTTVSQRISGLPPSRVIGSGTVLDTSRLKFRLSEHTGVDARNIHSYVLGEHGDTELVAWSLTTIAGMSLEAYCASCGACEGRLSDGIKDGIYDDVKNAGYHIVERKGATYYAVALAVRRIVEAVLRDEHAILTVSSRIDGPYGISGVCLSLPCIVSAHGVERVLEVPLTDEERQKLHHSADTLKRALADVSG